MDIGVIGTQNYALWHTCTCEVDSLLGDREGHSLGRDEDPLLSGDTEAELTSPFLCDLADFLTGPGVGEAFFVALRGDWEIERLFLLDVLGADLWGFFFGGDQTE